MMRVAQYLREHLDEPIDAGALGKLAGLSARQLERVFARTIGESPRAHVRRLRLERAAVRLRKSRASILTIALEAGFESHEAFTRKFRERFGHSPSAYRQLAMANAAPRLRGQIWQIALAGGLRRHIESNPVRAASRAS
jgi:AraC family transcriptional regulator